MELNASRFIFELELGNEGMSTLEDVKYALRAVWYRIDTESLPLKVRDTNGNTVGIARFEH